MKLLFTRMPNGDVYLDESIGEGAKEWLASYCSGKREELSEKERERDAPLGAVKLYNAIKAKPVTTLKNAEWF